MSLSEILPVFALALYGCLSLLFYMKAKTSKARIFSAIMMGIFFAILAYLFIPKDDYDLSRHWAVANRFENVEDFDNFIKVIKGSDLEILPQIYSFIIAKIGNYHLMPAIIALVGYSALFYILIDYKNHIGLSKFKFFAVMLLVVFGQHILFYFSGLYNYLAINMFALAFYLDYIKDKKKAVWFIYLSLPFIHVSMLLPISLLLMFKLKKGKITKKFIISFSVALLFFTTAINFVVDILNIDLLTSIKNTYINYVGNNNSMIGLYDGFYLFMTISKMFIVALACWLLEKNNDLEKIKNFTYLLFVAVLILSFSSIAVTRFSSLVLFVATPVIMSALNRKTTNSKFLVIVIFCLGLLYLIYSVLVMKPLIGLL